MNLKTELEQEFGAEIIQWIEGILKRAVRHTGFRSSHMDDLRGEAFLALVECKEKFDTEAGVPFRAFAYQRVRGAMIDYLRKELRGVQSDAESLDELLVEPEADEVSLDSQLSIRRSRSIVTESLEKLPQESKDLIRKRYVDDLPFEQLGADSRSAAFKKHRRVLSFLRKELAECNVHSYQEAA